jgi:hypothetical protein
MSSALRLIRKKVAQGFSQFQRGAVVARVDLLAPSQ